MKKVLILNGPNLNLLGRRQPEIYGNLSMEECLKLWKTQFPNVDLVYRQSNVEGELINILHEFGFSVDGIVFNPGAYAHTSLAIADAVRSISAPTIEVHISNIHARESYRQHSFVSAACKGSICGLGTKGYELAIEGVVNS